MSLLPETLAFGETPLTLIDRQGEPWLTAMDLGRALGYAHKGGDQTEEPFTSVNYSRPILNIYDRHADEFTDQMTALVDMETPGGRQKVRIFSPRGCSTEAAGVGAGLSGWPHCGHFRKF
ncbi:MAG: hypothetical protein PHF72_12930 [Gammaproteobacteria bacterium]|nr:hypothetical protein [Gammaproteobacteria bacterium]